MGVTDETLDEEEDVKDIEVPSTETEEGLKEEDEMFSSG